MYSVQSWIFLLGHYLPQFYSKCDDVVVCVAGGGDQPGGLRLSLDPDK